MDEKETPEEFVFDPLEENMERYTHYRDQNLDSLRNVEARFYNSTTFFGTLGILGTSAMLMTQHGHHFLCYVSFCFFVLSVIFMFAEIVGSIVAHTGFLESFNEMEGHVPTKPSNSTLLLMDFLSGLSMVFGFLLLAAALAF